jgi:hypothetical protein
MFKSNEALFRAVNDLLAALEKTKRAGVISKLRDGMSALNGLTDGWAAFLESIDDVRRHHRGELDERQRASLEEIRDAVYYCVHRRKARWWRFW